MTLCQTVSWQKNKLRELTDLLSCEAGFKRVFKKGQLNFRLMEDFVLVLDLPLKFWVCFSAVSKFFNLARLPLKNKLRMNPSAESDL